MSVGVRCGLVFLLFGVPNPYAETVEVSPMRVRYCVRKTEMSIGDSYKVEKSKSIEIEFVVKNDNGANSGSLYGASGSAYVATSRAKAANGEFSLSIVADDFGMSRRPT